MMAATISLKKYWWFPTALLLLVVSQVFRLHVSWAPAWIAWDYGGRIVALVFLAIVPAARDIAFRAEDSRCGWPETIAWTVGLAFFTYAFSGPLGYVFDSILPGTRLGRYPLTQGFLYALDMTFGLALVACTEEIVFRRCARAVLKDWCGGGLVMILTTSILFAAYHWWSGIGNIVVTLLFGIAAMIAYRRMGSIVPVIVGHYLADALEFA